MEQNLRIELRHGEATEQALARTVTSPECLSASVQTDDLPKHSTHADQRNDRGA